MGSGQPHPRVGGGRNYLSINPLPKTMEGSSFQGSALIERAAVIHSGRLAGDREVRSQAEIRPPSRNVNSVRPIGQVVPKFLRTRRRNQPLFPHRTLAPVADMLDAFAELADAVGLDVDERWSDAAAALEAAAVWVRSAYSESHRSRARRDFPTATGRPIAEPRPKPSMSAAAEKHTVTRRR